MLVSGPTINRSESSGDIWTPQVFIDAVERKFGRLVLDLACTRRNCKAPEGIYYPEGDSLQIPWTVISTVKAGGLCYLNPPFSNITPWARKCAEEAEQGARILLLVPHGQQNWYWDYVHQQPKYGVGRMVFDNCFDKKGQLVTTPYPKDLTLVAYNARPLNGAESLRDFYKGRELIRWRWQDE